MEVTRAFLPGMRSRGSGRIMVLSSNAVDVPHPLFAPYAATKWGLEGWAEALAMELARGKVRATCPGQLRNSSVT